MGLGLAGVIVHPLVRSVPSDRLDVRPISATVAAGSGNAFVVLGGLRTVVADLVWLRAYMAWEKRDAPATEALLELTTTLDPRPLYFWINGARIMAYDMPVWMTVGVTSESVQTRVDTLQAKRALAYLDGALLHHPARASLWIERANIELHRLHDIAAAAESYRQASQQPDAPYYAARIQAELLRRIGRKAEALACLTELYPRLPLSDETAGAALVLSRIRSLEAELGKSPSEFLNTESSPLDARMHL